MRNSTVLLALMCASASADDRAPMKNGVYPEKAAAWKKFEVQGLRIGMPLEKQAGFTCGPPPGTNGFTTQNHSCVKFVDERCKGRATKIHMIRVAADVPGGQNCFMDEFNGATYLDRKFISPPLKYVRIIGTDTTAPLIAEIDYTFAADDLTDDSNLGKALIAKYGQPSSKNNPIAWSWNVEDTTLGASCRSTVGPQGEYCTLSAEDRKLDQVERSIQEEANEAAKHKNAPEPPKL